MGSDLSSPSEEIPESVKEYFFFLYIFYFRNLHYLLDLLNLITALRNNCVFSLLIFTLPLTTNPLLQMLFPLLNHRRLLKYRSNAFCLEVHHCFFKIIFANWKLIFLLSFMNRFLISHPCGCDSAYFFISHQPASANIDSSELFVGIFSRQEHLLEVVKMLWHPIRQLQQQPVLVEVFLGLCSWLVQLPLSLFQVLLWCYACYFCYFCCDISRIEVWYSQWIS